MDIVTFAVTYVLAYVTAAPVVTYVADFLCAILTSLCISSFGVRIVIVSNIRVSTIVGSNRLFTMQSLSL